MSATPSLYNPRIAGRKRSARVFELVALASILIGILALVVLLADVFTRGVGTLSWDFLSNFPSRRPEDAGIKSALFGTLWMIFFTALFAYPLGVGSALYLEEYSSKNKLTTLIQLNIANLAGVPSIVYGLLGLGLFVRFLSLERSVLAGSLTMAVLILPIIIISSQEALRAVPTSIREAAYALGASRWQVIWHHVLPSAFPGILTGTILAISRAIGETAPLITIGALTFIAFTPDSPMDPFTVLPIQIFNWVSRPQPGFHALAASGIIVLLVVLLTLNAAAILLRNRFRKSTNW